LAHASALLGELNAVSSRCFGSIAWALSLSADSKFVTNFMMSGNKTNPIIATPILGKDEKMLA
jgi:hypothetical protein